MNAKTILDAMRAKGHVVFEDEPYDLNLFGVRTVGSQANSFDDVVGVLYRHEGRWLCYTFPATTDPGTYWREHPMRLEGTAILKPGQYRGSHMVGEHKGYPALQQRMPVTVWRDNNKDDELDEGLSEHIGDFGINIHRANRKRVSVQVGKWSAGCQVIADPLHFSFLMALARAGTVRWGNSLTYTLLTMDDL